MKRYKFISITVGIILALTAGELFLRAYKFQRYSSATLKISENSELVFEHRPSITFTNRRGIKIKYNSLGFIGDEIAPKTKDTFRILGVGDSITAAEYLPEKKRYLNVAGALLSERMKRNVEVINAGVEGYNSWQELVLIRLKGLSVNPDLILVGVCLNDDCGWRPELKKTWFGKIKEVRKHHKKARHFSFLYQRSCLYEFLYDFLYNMKKLAKEKQNFFNEYNRYEVENYKPNLEIWKGPLIDMISFARGHGIEIMFIIFPFEQQILRGDKTSFEPLIDFFKGQGVYYVDLIDVLNRQSGQHLYLRRDPVHVNELGHRIVAETIADFIIKDRLIR